MPVSKLDGVVPEMQARTKSLLLVMSAVGHPMMVTDGFRTTAQQAAKWAQGRTLPGPIVTRADGIHVKSNHQSGRAVDCCFLVDGQPSWAESHPWKYYGATAKILGLQWGGDWAKPDRPHIELSKDDL